MRCVLAEAFCKGVESNEIAELVNEIYRNLKKENKSRINFLTILFSTVLTVVIPFITVIGMYIAIGRSSKGDKDKGFRRNNCPDSDWCNCATCIHALIYQGETCGSKH